MVGITEKETAVSRKERMIAERKGELYNALSKIRTAMLASNSASFLASDVFQTDISFSSELEKMGMPTMCTDGVKIMIDPEFFLNNDKEENLWGLCHESLHNMFGHVDLGKAKGLNRKAYNIACDAVINATLRVASVGREPKNVISSDYSGNVSMDINGSEITIYEAHKKTSLEVYDEIMKHVDENPPPEGGGDGDGDGDGNDMPETFDIHDHKELSDEEKNEIRRKQNDKLIEGKMRGNMPGFLAEKLGRILEGKVNWRNELREMMVPLIKASPSYAKQRRRNPYPVILPGKRREGIKLSVGVDTSGSIGDNERAYFLGEIKRIFDQFPTNSVLMSVYFHHTHMYKKFDIKDIDDIMNFQFESGGTSHKDIMEKMVEDGTQFAVFLTDGYSEFPKHPMINRMFWVVTEKDGLNQIPDGWGKKLHVSLSDLREVQ